MNVPNIIEFVLDPELLGLSLSPAQETLLRTIYGLPLSSEQIDIYRECTGRERPPEHGFGEVTVLAGARAGKDSRIAAPMVVYEALFGGHEKQLARGEKSVIPLVAQDKKATKIAYDYIREYLMGSKVLASTVEEVLAYEITLTNGTTIACFPCTNRSLRGWSIPSAALDEVAFFRLEGSAVSDAEIQASIRRGMLNFTHPRLVKISTPYMKSGVLFDDFRTSFGQDDPDRLVWKASTVLMNPSIKSERLERERRLDPQRFAREYEAEFSDDVEAFLPHEWVEDAVVEGRHELPPRKGVDYIGAVDPSGGGADAFTFSIVHVEDEKVVQDVMRGWKRARDLEGVVKEIATIAKTYGLRSVVGDKYAGQWVPEAFSREELHYNAAEMTKAEAYLESQPLFAQKRIELLDHPTLARELRLLESRPRAGGKTLVDHPRGSHDDFANALCLAVAVSSRHSPPPTRIGVVSDVMRTRGPEGLGKLERLPVEVDPGRLGPWAKGGRWKP